MRNLLDTHTLIWFVNGDMELSIHAKEAIKNGENFLSIASIWEIAIKVALKKLDLYTSFKDIKDQIRINNINILAITIEDTFLVSELPHYHKDPFDRIIIAQYRNNGLTLISKDRTFGGYDVPVVW
jgi:PIN domain nuclease of toxin-antitoxin system